jgi:hypothetical protein
MFKIWRINHRTWIDDSNVVYKQKDATHIETSDGRILASPSGDAPIYLDGIGNGYLLA